MGGFHSSGVVLVVFVAVINYQSSRSGQSNMISSSGTKTHSLLLRVHLSDGSVQSFVQANQAKADQIWKCTDPTMLFAGQRLVIAGINFESVFVCSEIVRMDFIEPIRACWQIPDAFADVVELTEREFRENARLDHPGLMPERKRPVPVGNSLMSFLKLHFRKNPPIFLMARFPERFQSENHSLKHFLLSKTAFQMRLARGGVGVINLAHLTGYTAYPGFGSGSRQFPGGRNRSKRNYLALS
jgi:hypothetical protein